VKNLSIVQTIIEILRFAQNDKHEELIMKTKRNLAPRPVGGREDKRKKLLAIAILEAILDLFWSFPFPFPVGDCLQTGLALHAYSRGIASVGFGKYRYGLAKEA
jgi:hypothetical protein